MQQQLGLLHGLEIEKPKLNVQAALLAQLRDAQFFLAV